MPPATVTDEELLCATDVAAFGAFYRRHFESLLGFFARRTFDPELAADLTAETFAAALAGRSRYRPEKGSADSWLYAIAYHKLADALRRGYAEDRARRRLGMEPIDLTDADIARIVALGGSSEAGTLVAQLPSEQREAIRAHVVDERSYAEIAARERTSEAVIRKRVSRGLAIVRRRMGGRA